MKLHIKKDAAELGCAAAELTAKLLREAIDEKGFARLILSTGASQFETLQALVKEDVDWSKVTMFHLDEYVALPEEHPASFRKYLKERFINLVHPGTCYLVDGDPDSIPHLTELLREAPVDVGLIGIGENAHIAFNDPPADFQTRDAYIVVNLNDTCKKQQGGEGWFPTINDVPKQAISMTAYQIMQCRHIISSVPHRVKAKAVADTLHSEIVTPDIPATLLKTHPDFQLFVDGDSAALVKEDKIVQLEPTRKVTVALAGAGARGVRVYGAYAGLYPEEMEIVAVAEPNEERLKDFCREHNIPENRAFHTAEEMFALPKMADMAFIATLDKEHVAHAEAAIGQGYDLLLEKPISDSLAECEKLLALAEEKGVKVSLTHVLRYAPFYQKAKQILDQGMLGKIVSIQASENVSYWHAAHSYVRGNFRRSEDTSPMIMAKCCHDLDLIVWLTGSHCKAISSFGGRSVFCQENMPEGATPYCYDGCKVKDGCQFDAEKIYMTGQATGYDHKGAGQLQFAVTSDTTREGIEEALKHGPFGRCVYCSDNTVVDHQVLCAEMENGVTVDFSMCSFGHRDYRLLHILGTKGELEGNMEEESLTVHLHGGETYTYNLHVGKTITGHGGGDFRMLSDVLANERGEMPAAMTSLRRSMESHYMAIAAEESRKLGGQKIEMEAFLKKKE